MKSLIKTFVFESEVQFVHLFIYNFFYFLFLFKYEIADKNFRFWVWGAICTSVYL